MRPSERPPRYRPESNPIPAARVPLADPPTLLHSPTVASSPRAARRSHPEAHSDTWAAPLQEALAASCADRDQEILDAAKGPLEQADPEGSAAGKYRIDLRDAQGVQVGDRGQMTVVINSLSGPAQPARRP
jgi:hypothetical protein